MKKIKSGFIIFPLLLIFIVTLFVILLKNDTQAMSAIPLKITFQGEYKIGDGEWKKYSQQTDIPANKGDVHLKGFYQLETDDGEVVGRANKDTCIMAHYKHIGGYTKVNGEVVTFDSIECKQFGASSCGEMWISFYCPADENDEMELVFHNPHKYGNKDSINTFLNSMTTYTGSPQETQKLNEGKPERYLGFGIMVVSFIILGVAVFSSVINIPYNKILWIFGFMNLISGGFFVLDSPNFFISDIRVIVISTLKNLCIMLYPLCLFALVTQFLKDKKQKIGKIIYSVYGIILCTEILIALFANILLYDLNFYLLMIQFAFSVVMTVLCILNFRDKDIKQKIINSVCLITLTALGIDDIAVIFNLWNTALVSKTVFFAVFVVGLIYSLKIIPENIKSSIHEKKLQYELQQNKISVMTSQIQPHFLNNALTAICNLCDTEPKKAQSALSDFAIYLRENVNALGNTSTVHFEQEIAHIQTYINLEKLRFGDKINVVFDLKNSDFEIQPLTIQPLVENAIKHGICHKEKGGTITVKSDVKNDIVTISVIDNGVGFDVEKWEKDTSQKHVGLKNVKMRVEHFPKGKFDIQSEKGKGTVITISYKK